MLLLSPERRRLGLSSDLWDGIRSHDSGEEFGHPGASFGAQVLHEFHVDDDVVA